MSQATAVEFLTSARQDEGLKQRLKAAMSADKCVEVGQASGYNFTTQELQNVLDKMSDKDVAEIINPGVAPRRHISPR